MIVTSAIWLAFVAVALWPPFRRGPLGFAVFVITMTFNEIPAIPLLAFVTSIVFAGRPSGALETVLAVGLVGATSAGLVWLQMRAHDARGAFEAGLDERLGEGWRSVLRAERLRGSLLPTPWAAGILLPFPRRGRGVMRSRNLRYGPHRAHTVDVYRAVAGPGARPVLIHLHGGGFVSGRKSRESVALLNRLATDGWLCLSANYRLRQDGLHPNPLIDVKRLIAWTRENADELGADSSSVFLAGCSAGAHLAVSAALTWDGDGLQPGFEAADARVAGVIAFYGYLGPRTADPSSSPRLLARSDAPPMLIVHGTNDTAVPVEDVRAVAADLDRASRQPVVFVELPQTQHSFDRFASVRSRVAADAAETFLLWARRGPEERLNG